MKKLLSLVCITFCLNAHNDAEKNLEEYAITISTVAHAGDFLLNSYIINKAIKGQFSHSPRTRIITSVGLGAVLTLGSLAQSYKGIKNNPKNLNNADKNIAGALGISNVTILGKCCSALALASTVRLAGILAAHPGALFFGLEGFFLAPPIFGLEKKFVKASIIGSQSLYLGLSAAATSTSKRPYEDYN